MKTGYNVHLGPKSQLTSVHMFRDKIKQAINLQIINHPDPSMVVYDGRGWPTSGFSGNREGYLIRCLNYAYPLGDPFTGKHYLCFYELSGSETVRVTWGNDAVPLTDVTTPNSIYSRVYEFTLSPEARQLKIYVEGIQDPFVPECELYHESDFNVSDPSLVSDYWLNFHSSTEAIRLMTPTQTNYIKPHYASADGLDFYTDNWSYVGDWQARDHMPVYIALQVAEELHKKNNNLSYWLNVPVNISDEVAIQMFDTMESSPIQEFIVEAGNELWHDSFSFECFGYLRDQAVAKWGQFHASFDVNGDLIDDVNNGWIVSKDDMLNLFGNNILNVRRNVSHPAYTEAEAVYQYVLYVYERLMKLYTGTKIKWVLGINGGWGSHFSRYIADSDLASPTVKDFVLQNMYAITPALYLTNYRSVVANGEPTDFTELFNQLTTEAPQYVNSILTNYNQAVNRYPHLKFMLYEFGSSLVPRNKQDQAIVDLYWNAATQPEMYTLYTDVLTQMLDAGCELVLHYEDVTPYSLARYGRWGVVEFVEPSTLSKSSLRAEALAQFNQTPVVDPSTFEEVLSTLSLEVLDKVDTATSAVEIHYWYDTLLALRRVDEYYQTRN